MASKPMINYRQSGVDIAAGNQLVKHIAPMAKSTTRPEVMGGLGGFGALFKLDLQRYRNPVLVAGTDGVGTKLRLAIDAGQHDGVGIDLVAMCVNDLLVQGAEPLFFLDYYATAKLDVAVAAAVVSGIAEGCRQCGAALVGGETAEMPGMYTSGDYDLAGFCVGVVDQERVLDGSRCAAGDILLGVASSGLHSNGYSLVRRLLEVHAVDLQQDCGGRPLLDALLEPTRIYVKSLLPLVQDGRLHAMAHITGGGLLENLPRVLPIDLAAEIQCDSWRLPPVYHWLNALSGLPAEELLRTFNQGVGMVVVVHPDEVNGVCAALKKAGEQVWSIGRLVPKSTDSAVLLR